MAAENDLPEWLRKLKQRREVSFLLLGAAVFGGIATLVGNLDKILSFFRSQTDAPKIISIKLSESSKGYIDEPYRLDPSMRDSMIVRSFVWDSFQSPQRKYSDLVLLITVENPIDRDLVLDKIRYVVTELSGVSSGTSGAAKPLHKYNHKLDYKLGQQVRELTPTFVVAAKSTAAFEVALTTSARDICLAWLLTLEILTSRATLRSEQFAIWLDGRFSWEKDEG